MSMGGPRSSSRFVILQTMVLVATLVLLVIVLRRLARLSRQVSEIGERQVAQGVGQRTLAWERDDRLSTVWMQEVDRVV
jgi:hypothetical protein